MKPIHERFHQPPVVSLSGGKHLRDFAGVAGERFFAKHMFTSGQRAASPLAMQTVVERDDDGIHTGISEQTFVTGVSARNFKFRSGGAGAGGITTGNGDEFETGQQPARLRVFADNRAGAEDAEARVHHRQISRRRLPSQPESANEINHPGNSRGKTEQPQRLFFH